MYVERSPYIIAYFYCCDKLRLITYDVKGFPRTCPPPVFGFMRVTRGSCCSFAVPGIG